MSEFGAISGIHRHIFRIHHYIFGIHRYTAGIHRYMESSKVRGAGVYLIPVGSPRLSRVLAGLSHPKLGVTFQDLAVTFQGM
jgi:hypothetical protein